MQTLTGLFDHMVLQRSGSDRSDAAVTGQSSATGAVIARVTRDSKALPGFAGKVVGKAARGVFQARLAGIPVGGPYVITLSIGSGKDADVLTVKDVLVGDIWVAAGQSNMEGCGQLADAAKPHPMARAFYTDDHWGIARDPVNRLAISIDEVHTLLNGNVRPALSLSHGTGPSVAFAQEMFRVTGVPQGVIASAHGGTSMAQWDPAKKSEGSRSLYGATLRRIAKNGGKVAGMIWYQGESDASPEAQPLYVQNMKEFVASLRRDTKSPDLPFALVQIGRVVATWANTSAWSAIQEDQRLLPTVIRRCTVVPSVDLTLDDLIHISGKDHQKLGRHLAGAMLALLRHPKAPKPPIALKSVTVKRNPMNNNADITIEFDHVIGALQSGGRPNGFTVVDPAGNDWVYAAELHGNQVVLHLTCPVGELEDRVLQYGRGSNPACNITDAAVRSLPVFGPRSLVARRACTPFVSASASAAGGRMKAEGWS